MRHPRVEVIHEIHEASRQNAPVLDGVDRAPPDPQRAQALWECAADRIAGLRNEGSGLVPVGKLSATGRDYEGLLRDVRT